MVNLYDFCDENFEIVTIIIIYIYWSLKEISGVTI